MIKVVKFGGSSVSCAAQFKKVKEIIQSDPSRRLVVVSAAGKKDPTDHKLTDLLYLCHAHLTYGVPCDEIFGRIRERLVEIRDELGLAYRIEDDLDSLEAKLSKDMSIDELVSRGEYFTSRLMAEYLGFHFLDASKCIFMEYDGSFVPERISEAVSKALGEFKGVVVPGFYGVLPSGKIRLMSRGGSDITGALVAAACKADLYENWTDVSGILMADPRIVDNPSPISKITYSELRELAYMGASVLHEDSVAPVKDAGIPLNIRNTNDPSHPGTMIVERIDEKGLEHDRFITGIAGHITIGIDQFALVLPLATLGDGLYDVISEIKGQCKPDSVEVQDNIALVAAVGRKMIFRPGISGKLFNALGKEGINIRTIAQGSDELAIIVGVDNSQFENTIRILYQGFAG